MSSDQFNSLSGYSVGIPPVEVVNANGNIVTNVNYPNGNVTANTVYANNYRYSNGAPFATAAGGNNSELQFNNNGSFAGIPNVEWDGANLTLGNVANVKLLGGDNGYFLQTDGAGGLTWAPASGGGNIGNGVPGGANTQVQFNNGDGNFAGAAGFTFDNVTNVLSVPNFVSANADIDIINAGNITANYFIGDGSQLTGIVPVNANYVIEPDQSNITSLGNLIELNVDGPATFTGYVDLGDTSNLTIAGGMSGYVLTTDGTGNITWEPSSGNGGSPGGANTYIQFNNNGNFDGSEAFTFNPASNGVVLTGNLSIRHLTANNGSFYGNLNVTSNVTANLYYGNGIYLTDVVAVTSGTVTASAQPNITSVGTLGNLVVSNNIAAGQTITAAAIEASGNLKGNLLTANSANIVDFITTGDNATVDFSSTELVDLGSTSNVKMAGGVNGYVLTTDGIGNLTWQPPATGNGGSPGGLNTQVQYNKNGDFAGSAFFTFNDGTNTVQVGGLLIANVFQVGSGGYKFGTTAVHTAQSNTTSKVTLYSIPVANCSGVEFDIVSTNSIEQKRQFVKISSVYYAGQVAFTEYAGLNIDGGIGNFAVEYNPGNVVVDPSVDLTVIPNSANNVTYRMLITILAP